MVNVVIIILCITIVKILGTQTTLQNILQNKECNTLFHFIPKYLNRFEETSIEIIYCIRKIHVHWVSLSECTLIPKIYNFCRYNTGSCLCEGNIRYCHGFICGTIIYIMIPPGEGSYLFLLHIHKQLSKLSVIYCSRLEKNQPMLLSKERICIVFVLYRYNSLKGKIVMYCSMPVRYRYCSWVVKKQLALLSKERIFILLTCVLFIATKEINTFMNVLLFFLGILIQFHRMGNKTEFHLKTWKITKYTFVWDNLSTLKQQQIINLEYNLSKTYNGHH